MNSTTIPEELKATLPSIEGLRARLDEARSDAQESRPKCRQDRDYYDGPKQLSDTVRAVLRQRNQPPIYTNRVRPAVNGVLGVLEQGRRDPRALPRNPDDENTADVCTKTLRFINDQSKFNDTQIDIAENFFIEGTGAVIVEMRDGKIVPTQIRWEEFYFDPYARRADLKDATYMGIFKWKDAEEIKSKYEIRIDEIGDPLSLGNLGFGDSWQDRPDGRQWIDRKRKRIVQVEEYAIIRGIWMRIVYIGSGVLEYGPSPYLDEKKRPSNPIEGVSCYVDNENNRYGIVRDMIPIQDEVNSSRSRSLHLQNSRTVQQVDLNAAPVDSETVRREAAKADGVLPPGYQIVSTAEQSNAALLRNQEAKSEIERMGPTPAVLGRQEGGNQSGRARLVSQQAGLTELARPLGRYHAWVLRCYEQMWNRARQFWTDPMWIRVTDEVHTPQFLQVNEPEMGIVQQPVIGPDGNPVIDPLTGQPQVQAAIGVVSMKHRLAEMDMDIILDQTDDSANLQQEIWAELMELLRLGMSPFSPEFEIAIEMSPLSDKQRILERLKAKRDEMETKQGEQGQQQAEIASQAASLALEKEQATVDKLKSEAEENRAQTQEIEARTHKIMLEPFRQSSALHNEAEEPIGPESAEPIAEQQYDDPEPQENYLA
jgi:hypothetical protein